MKISKEFDHKKLEKSISAMYSRLLKHIGQAESRVTQSVSVHSNGKMLYLGTHACTQIMVHSQGPRRLYATEAQGLIADELPDSSECGDRTARSIFRENAQVLINLLLDLYFRLVYCVQHIVYYTVHPTTQKIAK